MSEAVRTLGSFTCGLLHAVGANTCVTYDSVTAAGIVTLGVLAVTGLLVATRQMGF